MATAPRPTEITLHQQSRRLDVAFDDGQRFEMPCEYLRVFSPSAEVRGHGPGQEVLQTGKRAVDIKAIEPVGRLRREVRLQRRARHRASIRGTTSTTSASARGRIGKVTSRAWSRPALRATWNRRRRRAAATRAAAREREDPLRLPAGRGNRQGEEGRRGLQVGRGQLRPHERPHVVRDAPPLEALRDRDERRARRLARARRRFRQRRPRARLRQARGHDGPGVDDRHQRRDARGGPRQADRRGHLPAARTVRRRGAALPAPIPSTA